MSTADTLNHECYCRTLNRDRLQAQLESHASLSGLAQDIMRTRPHLFSSTVVFLSRTVAAQIEHAVAALDRVSTLPAYQTAALARAPAIAQHAFGPSGVFMGHDFHLAPQAPKLIEINTNAGGALLNTALARAQQTCCEAMDWAFKPDPALGQLHDKFFNMFEHEWQRQRGDAPLRCIAIVDEHPAEQYLAPEFELFREMFQQRGLDARIIDPKALEWQDGQLMHQGTVVDMVYNRLTDFYLSDPAHTPLRSAFEAGAVVMSPHPRAHAVQADKRNLITLGDDALLASWGASEADRRVIANVVPQTRLVSADNADELWAQRRQCFFKPVAGYGAKAAYRGDKLTRKVWGEILAGDFVAQALVPPTERLIEVDGELTDLKFDVRAYTYEGRVQLLAARMYTGQTTNFRTPGGGFAPVVVVD